MDAVINYEKKKTQLVFQEICGKEQFDILFFLYAKGPHFLGIVYDITNEASFAKASALIDKLRHLRENQKGIYILIGNKTDLDNKRVITKDKGKQLAEEKGCLFIEVSSKEGNGIEILLNDYIIKRTDIYQKKKPEIKDAAHVDASD